VKTVDKLINYIIKEIERGTEHYDSNGNLLSTPSEILHTIVDEGGVYFRTPSLGLSHSLGGGTIETATRKSSRYHLHGVPSIWLRRREPLPD